jgi:hypothetical protein
MNGSPLVPLSQRIERPKDTVIYNIKLVGLRSRCAQTDDQNECYSFHNRDSLMHIFALGKIRRRQVYLFARFNFGAVWTLGLIEFRTKMRMGVLPFLP